MKVTEDQCTRMSANAYKEMNQNTGLENVHYSGMYQMWIGQQLTAKQLGAISAYNRAMFLEEAMLEIEVCKSLREMRGKMGHVATC